MPKTPLSFHAQQTLTQSASLYGAVLRFTDFCGFVFACSVYNIKSLGFFS